MLICKWCAMINIDILQCLTANYNAKSEITVVQSNT